MAKIFLTANPGISDDPAHQCWHLRKHTVRTASQEKKSLILMLTRWLTLLLTLSVVAGLRLAGNRVAARKNKEINMISAVGMSKGENSRLDTLENISIGMAAGQHTQTTRSKSTMHSLLRYHSWVRNDSLITSLWLTNHSLIHLFTDHSNNAFDYPSFAHRACDVFGNVNQRVHHT